MKANGITVLAAALMALLPLAGNTEDVPAAHQVLLDQFENLSPEDIRESSVPGLLEVDFDGSLLYATADGKYMIQGEVYDVVRKVNVTEEQRAIKRSAAMGDLDVATMIVFEAEESDAVERTITVFTDIDCGYCRKLHREIEDYRAAGIRVQYMFFPRSGPDTPSWAKANNVWCADDRNEALTAAKAGEILPDVECGETPVSDHYRLGMVMGVTGTPAIMTDSGVLIAGYMPAEELRQRLDQIADFEATNGVNSLQ